MCFINNLLVSRFTTSVGVLRVTDAKTGEYIKDITTKCGDENASIRSCQIRSGTSSRQDVLENCFRCQMFRHYDVITHNAIDAICDRSSGNIRPNAMCKGPNSTLIVYDRLSGSILQFTFSVSGLCNKRLVCEQESRVSSMTYNDHNGIVVLLSGSSDAIKVKGINIATGEAIWRRQSVPGSSHVCSGNTAIFVSGYGNDVTILDAADGFYLGTILASEHLGHIYKAVCSEEKNKLAILHRDKDKGDKKITCYSLHKKKTSPSYPSGGQITLAG